MQVQIEIEHSRDGGRVVEQVVTPMTPNIAGFRLDAPAAIRHAAKYTMSAVRGELRLDHTLPDDSFICPATLRIQVMALAVSSLSLTWTFCVDIFQHVWLTYHVVSSSASLQ